MSEEIIGRINGMQRTDSKFFNLIFTNNRMIGEFVGRSGGAGAALTFGLAGAVGAAVAESHLKKKSNQMDQTKTPDEILASHKKCFEINKLDIERVYVRKGVFESSLLLQFNQKIPKIGKAIQFNFSKKRIDEIESVVTNIFPNICEIKK